LGQPCRPRLWHGPERHPTALEAEDRLTALAGLQAARAGLQAVAK
jgi:hypothetical protein